MYLPPAHVAPETVEALGRVRLVVAEAPVADHVHDDVRGPDLAPLGGQLEGSDHRHGVVAVHLTQSVTQRGPRPRARAGSAG